MQVEICCNSVNSAVQALRGGASRIELCHRLEVGGVTPSAEDILYCTHQLGLRTHVLIRPREGDFCYSDAEFAQILEDIDTCKRCGAAAVVVGFLTPEDYMDEPRTREAVLRAAPMEVTFHRAFDEMKQNPEEALEAVIRCGCHRLLTSGCSPDAETGIPVLKQLVQQAAGRIIILAGAGITPHNARHIIETTQVTEIHGSCKHTLFDGTIQTDAEIVKQLVNQTL